MSGRNESESVAALDRNRWPDCSGMGGRFAPEYAIDVSGSPKMNEITISKIFSGSYDFFRFLVFTSHT